MHFLLGMPGKNKILIVEDNRDARELLTLFLRRSGYDILEAGTGLEAIDQTQAGHPDLILMDLGLPKMSGDEAVVRLKEDLSTRHIPIIVNTAFDSRGAPVQRALAAGAEEVMHKPVDLKALLDIVRRYLPDEAVITTANPPIHTLRPAVA